MIAPPPSHSLQENHAHIILKRAAVEALGIPERLHSVRHGPALPAP